VRRLGAACIVVPRGWWTYEVCLGGSISQFHEVEKVVTEKRRVNKKEERMKAEMKAKVRAMLKDLEQDDDDDDNNGNIEDEDEDDEGGNDHHDSSGSVSGARFKEVQVRKKFRESSFVLGRFCREYGTRLVRPNKGGFYDDIHSLVRVTSETFRP